jgi:hypothetical protein
MIKIFTQIRLWSEKTGPFSLPFQNFRFCCLEHLQTTITSLSQLQIRCSIYLFWSSRWGLHHCHIKSSVWHHLLVVSSTSLFFEWNSTKLSEKHVHNLKIVLVCPICEIYKVDLHLEILTILELYNLDLPIWESETTIDFLRMSNLVINTCPCLLVKLMC